MSDDRSSILLIEDDDDIASLLRLHLGDSGYDVTHQATGPSGLESALGATWNLIILDLMLPGLDGMEICRRIRNHSPEVPILMLTARGEEIDKILGFEVGADDYLTKPFSIRELLARVAALLRRSALSTPAPTAEQALAFGPLEINTGQRSVRLRGERLDLTAKEWELLVLMASNPGRTYSRQELLDMVWGYHYDGYSHTVNSHINRLRNKIEDDPASPRYVLTKRGLGYRFADPDMVADGSAASGQTENDHLTTEEATP